ncbi:MAG: YiiX/YebB-like N1pC/P60 family cysteine hydrolase [Bacteroidota bacterium]
MSPRVSSLICLLGFPALSGSPLAPPQTVDAAAVEAVAQPGDVVFRRGQGLVSRVVLSGDRDPEFSHVGIVAERDGALVVVHATPSDNGAPEPIRTEPLADFYAPESADLGAVRRPLDPTAGRIAATAAQRLARGRAFDPDLDLDTDDRLYCTELVWKAYRDAGIDLTDGQLDYAHGLLSHDGPLVFPSTLLHSPSLAPIPGLSL